MDFIDSSFYEMMSVGWATAEVDAEIPTQLGTGPWGLHTKERTHRHTVHLHHNGNKSHDAIHHQPSGKTTVHVIKLWGLSVTSCVESQTDRTLRQHTLHMAKYICKLTKDARMQARIET